MRIEVTLVIRIAVSVSKFKTRAARFKAIATEIQTAASKLKGTAFKF